MMVKGGHERQNQVLVCVALRSILKNEILDVGSLLSRHLTSHPKFKTKS